MTHMLKGCLGAGMLAMPSAISRVGLALGVLGCIFLGVFATYCIQILIVAQYMVCKKWRVAYMPYPMSMKLAVQSGPPCIRWTANIFANAVDAFLLFWQFGGCTVFMIFVAENLKQTLAWFNVDVTVRVLITCFYPIQFLIGLVRDLKLLAPLSTFSNITTLLGVILVFFYLMENDLEVDENKFKLKSLAGIPLYIGTVLFALEAVGVMLSLEYNMEKPKQFVGLFGLFSIGMAIIVALYLLLGVFGYIKYGDETAAAITLNLPKNEKKSQTARMLFAAALFMSFPLQNFVAWQILWGLIEKKFTTKKRQADYALRIACVTFPFVLAVAAPALGPFIGLIGSLAISTVAILFPAVIDISVYYPDKYGYCNYKLLTDILIILFGIFCGFSGIYNSLLEMVDALS